MVQLHYEPNTKARPVVIERDGRATRIVIPMQAPYVPVPKWVGNLDMLALVVAPVWWVATLLVRTCLRLPKPPRAVFEVTDERLKVSLHDPGSSEAIAFDWPRSSVTEARANRYDKGLWLNVQGHVKETFLTDVPRATIERLEAALHSALAGESVSDAAVGNAR